MPTEIIRGASGSAKSALTGAETGSIVWIEGMVYDSINYGETVVITNS